MCLRRNVYFYERFETDVVLLRLRCVEFNFFNLYMFCDQCFREPWAGYASNERALEEIRQGSNTSLMLAVTTRWNIFDLVNNKSNGDNQRSSKCSIARR